MFFYATLALNFLTASLTFDKKGVYCSAQNSKGMRAVSKRMYTKVSLVSSVRVQFAINS